MRAKRTARGADTNKIGRDAGTGRFKPVAAARRDRGGSVVETIRRPKSKKR